MLQLLVVFQEMELNAQTKHCLPKSEKEGLDQ